MPPADAPKQNRGLVILQIGDSHTAADYFSGEVRAKLQARYGSGGVGYIDAGKPTVGVRSGTMRISASPGWTYRAIQRSDNVGEFWLSGFNAVASAGMGAGLANDYVAPGDQRVLAHTKTIGGGQTTSVTFQTSILKPGGDYRYLCTFPGHNALMRGTLKFG